MKRPDEPLSEERLDELLSSLPAPEPSAALRRVVAEIPLRHPQAAAGSFGGLFDRVPAWFPFRSFGRAALWAVVLLALGALAGLYVDDELVASTPDGARQRSGTEEVSNEESETSTGDELDDLALLAFADDLDAELEP
jgi:hypothetical protein